MSTTLLPPVEVEPDGPEETNETDEPPGAPAAAGRRAVRFLRGREDDPAWVRPALLGLLVGTGFLYLWGLGASGWANSYYSAAVQAATKSWKAFFFGSSDAGNSITVDKAPAFLWPMDISARIFGVSSWSILVPQALEGVATVGLLYGAVRRWFQPAAALIAGTVVALTPVAALMFRFNNPDALLVLLMTAAAYAMVRALERGSTRWVVLALSLVGFGFLAKMLQAFLVAPALALVYLVAAPTSVRRRLWQLAVAGAAMVASCLWWILAVQLTPASSRPYIGGSQNNSLWNLIFGYNGFGRLTGSESGSVGGGGNGTGRWGPTGWTRLFNAQFGGQISWLLPTALFLLVAMLALTWRSPRTARTRAAMLLFGGWLLLTGAAISLGKGIIHPYYTVALAPPIGAVIGIGTTSLWRERHRAAARMVLAAVVAATAWWSYELLGRTPSWHPSLRTAVLVAGIVGAGALAATNWLDRRVAIAVSAVAGFAVLAGPAAYTWATVMTPQSGAIPSAGPAAAAALGGGPGGRGGPGGIGGGGPFRANGTPPANPGNGAFGRLGGGPGGPGVFNGTGRAGGATGGIGGILNSSSPSAELTSTLRADSNRYTWIAATISANQAAGYQLATGDAVMAIGGFNGTDPSPTLAQFQQWVAAGRIHYFIAGGGGAGGPGGGSSSTSTSITSWVARTFSSTTVGGVTLYDLTSTAASQ